MKNIKLVSKLILKKSSSYLRISLGLLILSLVLISTASIFLINQYVQVNKDFINNKNTHTIQITTSADSLGRPIFLKFSDENKIDTLITNKYPNVKYKLYKEYLFDFGIFDSEGQRYFIHGLDEDAANILGKCDLSEDTIFTKEALKSEAILKIPCIDIEQGGWSSGNQIDYKVKIKSGIFTKSPFFSVENDRDVVYVGSKTFKKIIEMSYKTNWNEFQTKYDIDNVYGIQAMHCIYVYLDDIRNVDLIGTLLNNKYNTNYTFKAFDDFGTSIENTIIIFCLFAIIILLINTMHVVLAFNSYLKVQQKDMGILKQMGYNVLTVFKIYARNINLIFVKVGVGIILYVLIVGYMLIKYSFALYITYLILSILILLIAINKIITHLLLKGYVKKDILTLLKINKEFE